MRIDYFTHLIVFVILVAPWVAAVGWLSGRVLGIRLRPAQAGLTAILGWAGGVTITGFVFDDDPRVAVVVLSTLFFGVLVAMPVAIVLDVVRHPTSPAVRARRRGRILHPFRTVRLAFAPFGRMREIVRIARRHGVLHVRYRTDHALDAPDFARRLRLTLEDAGGMMVKFGQIASTRTDLLPASMTDELAKLQASVRPVAASDVRTVIEEALGEPVETTFAAFDWEPLAAASIGQTHRARLQNGTPVVVKVQRRGVADLVDRDAAVLRLVARQAQRRVDAARRIGVVGLVDELVGGIEAELDYLDEAAAGLRFASQLDGTAVRVPAVYLDQCASTVLVMDEVPGRSIADPEAVDSCGLGRTELARRLLESFLVQILQDGSYHADPHPGNVFVSEGGDLWLIDFGSVGTITPIVLEGLQGIAVGLGLNDASLVARGVRRIAGDRAATDLRALESDLSTVIADMGTGFDPALIRQILATMDRHGLTIPSSLTLLSRSLITLEGTLSVLSPGFDFAATGEEMARADAAATAGTPDEILEHELVRALPSLRTLPESLEAITDQMRAGTLSIRSERFAGDDRAVLDDWINRLLIATSGAFGALASAVLLLAAPATSTEGVRDALWVVGFGGLTFSVTLLMRTAAQSLHRRPRPR